MQFKPLFCLTLHERRCLLALGAVLFLGSVLRYFGISRAEAKPGAFIHAQPEAARVRINSASLEKLEVIPGIGPKTAQAIITYRTNISYFYSVEDLAKVKGIGKKKAQELSEYVYF